MAVKKIPLRMCLGCREMKPKKELIRVVKSPEGTISIDMSQKAPGRGAYICGGPGCFKRVSKAGLLSKALKTAIPKEILDALQENVSGQQQEK